MEAPLAEKIFSVPECVVCLANPSTVLFQPCRHLCVCQACDQTLQEAKFLDCPLCCTKVETREKREQVDELSDSKTADLVVDFHLHRHAAFLDQLPARVRSNAGIKGNNKFARSVRRTFADAFEREQAENMGAERAQALWKNTELVETADELELRVNWKVGRRKFEETVSLEIAKPWEVEEDGKMTVLELATENPPQYWAWYRRYEGKVEAALEEEGLLKTERRRRRTRV